MNQDFRDIIELLLETQSEFLVVGAHAMAVHGAARATGDIDLLVRPTMANAELVCRALQLFGAPLAAHRVGPEQLSTADTVYQLGLPPRRIDVLTTADGLTFQEAWEGRVVLEVDGLHIPFLGLNELIRNKRAAGRPKDLADIALLEESQRGKSTF